MPTLKPLQGAGLGLRRAFAGPFAARLPEQVGFIEVAPENWIDVGGRYGRLLRDITERYPLAAHGLSLSIGSPAPLDEHFLGQLRRFLDEHRVVAYSDHLSYCSDHGQLYDLMPLPFTPEAATYVAERIRRVQDFLNRRIAIENISYYAAPSAEMTEIDFINAVLDAADCGLLLDVNNIYVNSINHRYDAVEFLTSLPADRVTYFHVAGHYEEAEDLRIDTHAAPVIDPVWDLLDQAYAHFGHVPTLLERDFNLPPLDELLSEVDQIAGLQGRHDDTPHAARRCG